jgi:alpha-beta hydrolase superfamily lysophospholipase
MLRELGYSTVMIDLQAHGESPGKQITVGHMERHDVRAAVQYARRQHPGEPIGVIGVSLGGAAALLASPLNINALVVESVYPNIRDAIHNRVSARLGPLSSIPSTLLLLQLEPRLGVSANELRPIDHIPNVACPVFVLSGRTDSHTTAAETQQLFAAATEPKSLWLVDGAAHVDLFHAAPNQYRHRVSEFLQRHLRIDRDTAGPDVE